MCDPLYSNNSKTQQPRAQLFIGSVTLLDSGERKKKDTIRPVIYKELIEYFAKISKQSLDEIEPKNEHQSMIE